MVIFLKYKKLLLFLFLVCCILVASLTGCGLRTEPKTEQTFLLDTIVSVTYYQNADREAVLGALELCRKYELVFSRTDSRSELYRLNEADRMEVSDALLTVLQTAFDYCRSSNGRFDITLGGVSALYGFSEEHPHCPDPKLLADALDAVGYEHIHIDGTRVSIDHPDAVIDLGAIAKGFIADEMKAYLAEQGVEHAIISLGGNIHTLGGKPDGDAFAIGIRCPEKDTAQLVATVCVSEDSVVTSGVYERFFVENGITYHHILDPATGAPLQTDLLSVSVIGPSSMHCDALSTVCFSMGLEGMELVENLEDYEVLFVTKDGQLHSSSGFFALQK